MVVVVAWVVVVVVVVVADVVVVVARVETHMSTVALQPYEAPISYWQTLFTQSASVSQSP